MPKQTKVKKAAIGWTISAGVIELRVDEGREKSPSSSGEANGLSVFEICY